MKNKPQFQKMVKANFTDEIPGFFTVVQIRSDGQNFNIEFHEASIPFFTIEVLEKMKFILEDGFYRTRPDLRKQ